MKDDGVERVQKRRPDILYVVSVLSPFLNSPSELHMQAAKRVLK